MTSPKAARPKPRKGRGGTKSATFQSRVDYVAKALKRGSWGRKFDECFEHRDSHHLIAVVMKRAERNEALRAAIAASFGVESWDRVPWHETAAPFAGMSVREIGQMADRVRQAGEAEFKALFKEPEKLLEPQD